MLDWALACWIFEPDYVSIREKITQCLLDDCIMSQTHLLRRLVLASLTDPDAQTTLMLRVSYFSQTSQISSFVVRTFQSDVASLFDQYYRKCISRAKQSPCIWWDTTFVRSLFFKEVSLNCIFSIKVWFIKFMTNELS